MFPAPAPRFLLPMAAAVLIAPGALAQGPETTQNSIGYFLGMSVGQNFRNQGFSAQDIDLDAMLEGLRDALQDKTPALSEEQLLETQGRIQAMLQQRQEALMKDRAKEGLVNQEKSGLWMTQNGKKKGVQELQPGLQYKVLASGQGGSPSKSDTVKVHYTGTLTDGTVFDSSVQRGEPATFRVGQVITGWQEALVKMKVGDKWMLYIAPELAYGEEGAGSRIGPNEVLIFEVELLEIL